MKAAKIYGIRDIRVEDVPVPKLSEPDEVLIHVKVAGICGSDISRYGKLGPRTAGATFGHEFSGIVESVGSDVQHIKPGDRVTACPSIPCFQCEECVGGRPALCDSLTVIGAKYDGAFAEYVKLSARNVIKLPDGLDDETAAGVEPTSVVLHGYYHTSLKGGDCVAVLGAGPIGLLALQCAKAFGAAQVIAIDVFDEKLDIARELGADVCVNAKNKDPVAAVYALTGGKGVDLAVEAAGTPFTSAQVFSLPRKGGSIVFMGIPYGDVPIPREHFEKIVRRELVIYGSWNAISAPFPGREWQTAIHFMKEGKVRVRPMVTHRIGIDELPQTFEQIYKRDTFFGKVMLFPSKI